MILQMMRLVTLSLLQLLRGTLCVPLRHQPQNDAWWNDIEATPWASKGSQLENSPYYNTYKQVDSQLHMYGYAQHVGKINRGKYVNPELNLPGHRAFGHEHDFNPGDLGSGAFRFSPEGQNVMAEMVHWVLGIADKRGEDIITIDPGHSINPDGTILVQTRHGQDPCSSNPCNGVFPNHRATCEALDDTTAKCERVIPGGWSDWGSYGECVECTRFRTRSCSKPPLANGDTSCIGDEYEEEACTVEPEACTGDQCPQCPSGDWSVFGSACYRLFDTKKSWDEAENQCIGEDGHLASVHSQQEHDFIVSLSSEPLWLGAKNDLSSEGAWGWSDGSCWLVTAWSGGEPNGDGGGQNCVETNYVRRSVIQTKKWNDVQCEKKLGFVCKKIYN